MTNQTCETCRYCENSGYTVASTGTCHFNPPVAFSDRSMAQFPCVRLTDWCGQWTPPHDYVRDLLKIQEEIKKEQLNE